MHASHLRNVAHCFVLYCGQAPAFVVDGECVCGFWRDGGPRVVEGIDRHGVIVGDELLEMGVGKPGGSLPCAQWHAGHGYT